MEKIKTVDFARYRVGESFEFNRIAAEAFAKCGNVMFTPIRVKHQEKLTDFDVSLKKQTFTLESEQISGLDYVRDNSLTAIGSSISHSLRCGVSSRVEAARRLDSIFSRYGNIKDLPYMQESGMVINLLQDLSTTQSVADLATIGATLWVADLQRTNDEFVAAFNARNVEEAAIETGATKRTRLETEEAFKDAAQCLNTLAMLDGFELYAEIINSLNNLIDRQKAIIKTRTGKGKTSPDVSEDGEDVDN